MSGQDSNQSQPLEDPNGGDDPNDEENAPPPQLPPQPGGIQEHTLARDHGDDDLAELRELMAMSRAHRRARAQRGSNENEEEEEDNGNHPQPEARPSIAADLTADATRPIDLEAVVQLQQSLEDLRRNGIAARRSARQRSARQRATTQRSTGPVKCPLCNTVHATTNPPTIASLGSRFQVSHDARPSFLQNHMCPICWETPVVDEERPMIHLACGHVVCKADFERMGGTVHRLEQPQSRTSAQEGRLETLQHDVPHSESDENGGANAITRRFESEVRVMEVERDRMMRQFEDETREMSRVMDLEHERMMRELEIQHREFVREMALEHERHLERELEMHRREMTRVMELEHGRIRERHLEMHHREMADVMELGRQERMREREERMRERQERLRERQERMRERQERMRERQERMRERQSQEIMRATQLADQRHASESHNAEIRRHRASHYLVRNRQGRAEEARLAEAAADISSSSEELESVE